MAGHILFISNIESDKKVTKLKWTSNWEILLFLLILIKENQQLA